jgi:hypothetical protein
MAQDSIRALQRRFELAIALAEFELGVSSKQPEIGPNDVPLATNVSTSMTARKCQYLPKDTKRGIIPTTKLQFRQDVTDYIEYIEPWKPGQPAAEFCYDKPDANG